MTDDFEPLSEPVDEDWAVEETNSGHEIDRSGAGDTVRTDAVELGVVDMDGSRTGTAIALAQAAEASDATLREIQIEADVVRVRTADAASDPEESPAPVPRELHAQLSEWGYEPEYAEDPTAEDYEYNSATYRSED